MAEQLPLFGTTADALVDALVDAPADTGAALPTAPLRPPAPDQDQRDLVTGALSTTLFVEAGAGSGKTTALVGRVTNLVLQGVPVGSIAAITFTEKAAAELRHRVRAALQQSAQSADVVAAALAQRALDDLDLAPIGTLHAFARRLLNEFPVEAQLPPRFEVYDEVQSATAFHERFTDFLEALLDDADNVRLVELCQHDRFGIETGVRRMADDFQSNWDLVLERVSSELPPPADDTALQASVAAACAAVTGFQAPPDDSQQKIISWFTDLAAQLAVEVPFGELLRLLDLVAGARKPQGNSANWKKFHGSADVLPAYKDAVDTAKAAAAAALAACHEERRLTLGALLREFTLSSVELRQQDGRLEFHDLLVLARRLVAEHPAVQEQLHQRYTHLLLDEFQDTDPIQLELAVRITAAPGVVANDWRQLQPLPGRLTVVGDPKQSIYRFRRADIAQFLRAREQIGATRAALSANFRSAAPLIEWVNHTMGNLIVPEPDVQPDYEPLVAARDHGQPQANQHGTVTVLGADAHADAPNADTLREREALDVASAVVQALAEGWPVWRDDALHPCRPGDIAILLPSRLSLPALETALADRGVPSRAENSSLVYAAPEVRALMLALRAADDPTDELAIVSALRTPLFGCSDRHLYEWKVTHGQRWQWWQIPEHLAEHPVARGLQCLGEVFERIPYRTPSQLLSWLVHERCVMELALAQRDSRDVWRRVRFVIDQARAWSEAGGHGVRRYLLWTRLQGDEGRFVAETVLPETDHDVVRIMTVHAAKGLEFPITIVSGLTSKGGASRGRRVVWTPTSWALSEPDDPTYTQFAPIDEQMSDAERKRLLYVACTRAMDHLVVSLHRVEGATNSAAAQLAQASDGAAHLAFEASDAALPHADHAPHELPWADEAQWAHTLHDDLARAGEPAALSATTLAARLAAPTHPQAGVVDPAQDEGIRKDPVDLDLPPWQRGRYGTAIGRAVHAVLQFADLRTGANIPDLAVAQAAAEGVIGRESTIERLARSALQAPVVAEGVQGRHWRELFVATQVGHTVVEGYIDLLVRHPQRGLMVVDYKTDQVPPGAERAQRVARYGTQLAAYGLALQQLLGEPVAGGVLVMCRTDGPAEQIEVDDWAALVADLAQRLDIV
ncbi:MAG: UvrD-helicase domain-containing protein [Actinobacteria bacterium]|nr:UvrD-helicase domain-containing protein [Actinomycetota bacterium]